MRRSYRSRASCSGVTASATASWVCPRASSVSARNDASSRLSPSRAACSVASSRAICTAERVRAASQPSAPPIAMPRRTRNISTFISMPHASDRFLQAHGRYRLIMGSLIVVLVIVVVVVSLGMFWNSGRKKREAQALADAREDALRWYERLGGQILNLSGDDPAVKQSLVD